MPMHTNLHNTHKHTQTHMSTHKRTYATHICLQNRHMHTHTNTLLGMMHLSVLAESTEGPGIDPQHHRKSNGNAGEY